MPSFLFRVSDGSRVFRDDEAVELEDLRAAADYARQDAHDLICHEQAGAQNWSQWRIHICDETGRELCAIPVLDAVRSTVDRDRGEGP